MACIVSSTSIFTCQIIVVADFLSADLNDLAQTEQFVALLHSFHCSRVSRFMGILLASCCLKIFATARTWFENFSVASSPYSLGAPQSIVRKCIPCRCSSHLVHDVSIGWWSILMTMAHTSLAYILSFWNRFRWQDENVVVILFLQNWHSVFVMSLHVASFWELDSLCPV